MCHFSSQQQRGWISGPAPPACQHRSVAQKENHKPVQVWASPPAHIQEDHIHRRPPPLVQRAWNSVQGSLCHRWDCRKLCVYLLGFVQFQVHICWLALGLWGAECWSLVPACHSDCKPETAWSKWSRQALKCSQQGHFIIALHASATPLLHIHLLFRFMWRKCLREDHSGQENNRSSGCPLGCPAVHGLFLQGAYLQLPCAFSSVYWCYLSWMV